MEVGEGGWPPHLVIGEGTTVDSSSVTPLSSPAPRPGNNIDQGEKCAARGPRILGEI